VHPDGSTTFRLWAPAAARVELVIDDRSEPLTREEHGWHTLRTAAAHGDRYGFRLDRGEERPDPASWRQPDGVHGRSAVVDPSRFSWTDEHWQPAPLAGAAIYELHAGTFTPEGTFAAAVASLPRLAALGVTHVEVMPVNAFNGPRGWGYDGVGWYAVHEPYGGPAGLAAFVDACHAAGLGVLLDVVYNHLGPSGNYLAEFGPYLTERYGTPWGQALNLDGPGADWVRDFIVGNARHWLSSFHVDGLRLDAVHGLIDTSAVHVLAELAEAVAMLGRATGRGRILVAESDRQDPQTVRPAVVGGLGLDGQWADDLHHAIHTAVTTEDEGYYADYEGLPDVARAYRRGFVLDGRWSSARERTVGARVPADVAGHRLVTCIQNHDQVGNRALGERLETVAGGDATRVAVLLLCAAPSTPMLFMGEEYAETAPFLYFTSHPEPELADAVRNGRRKEFADFTAFSTGHQVQVPDPQDPSTFRRSCLQQAKADSPAGRARAALWADLLRLRRTVPALGNGRRDLVEVLQATAEALVVVRRDPLAAPVMVLANLGREPLQARPPTAESAILIATGDLRYGGSGQAPTSAGGVLTVPAGTAALVALDDTA